MNTPVKTVKPTQKIMEEAAAAYAMTNDEVGKMTARLEAATRHRDLARERLVMMCKATLEGEELGDRDVAFFRFSVSPTCEVLVRYPGVKDATPSVRVTVSIPA